MGDALRVSAVAACWMLAACGDAVPPGNQAANASAAAPAMPRVDASAATTDAPLARWIVGTWSFDTSCATDFVIRYEGDGTLDNAGETGRWALQGDQLTETVTQRFENGGEAPVKVDPPVVRTYTLRRIDGAHGRITYQGRDVPIQRC
jgi:hypothetical protein